VRCLSLLAAIGCTGDADLGAERAPLNATPAGRDAGKPHILEASVADATATPVTTKAAAEPLALDVRVAGASVTQLQLACPEPCFTVELAANGGMPPYTFSWDDASSDAQRKLCLQSDTTLHASVHDVQGDSRSSSLDVHVTDCNVAQLCAMNPSFEGSPTYGRAWLSDAPLDAAPWNDCRMSSAGDRTLPKVVASASGDDFPDPSDGDSYLYLESASGSQRAIGQSLCAPLLVGNVYSLQIDLAGAAENNLGAPLSAVQVGIYASSSACELSEVLWTSPRLSTGWQTYCVTLKPTKAATALVLNAFGPGPNASAVFIDHLVPVVACP
jgi:hypothetical protein